MALNTKLDRFRMVKIKCAYNYSLAWGPAMTFHLKLLWSTTNSFQLLLFYSGAAAKCGERVSSLISFFWVGCVCLFAWRCSFTSLQFIGCCCCYCYIYLLLHKLQPGGKDGACLPIDANGPQMEKSHYSTTFRFAGGAKSKSVFNPLAFYQTTKKL